MYMHNMYVAQMDMTKSSGYRAVEELLKAQTTHMALRRQFEGARATEMTLVQREVNYTHMCIDTNTTECLIRTPHIKYQLLTLHVPNGLSVTTNVTGICSRGGEAEGAG